MKRSVFLSRFPLQFFVRGPKLPRFLSAVTFSVSCLIPLGLYSCGKIPTAVDTGKTGQIEVSACIVKQSLAKESLTAQTTFDSLIVEVRGSDCGLIRNAFKIDPLSPVIKDTVRNVPAGTSRTVKIYTVNRNGLVVHIDSTGDKTIRIDPGVSNCIYAVLIPAVGSIYVQIDNIPTNVDSIIARFVSIGGQSWSSHVKRSTHVNLSIDNIPNGIKGILFVNAIDSLGDTLYRAQDTIIINVLGLNSIPLVFTSTPGGLFLELSIKLPGALVASGSISLPEQSSVESGVLIITEIMYASNDSEYVELYNPGTHDTVFDTLFLDIDGTPRAHTNIAVPSNGFFVIGRRALPWADTYSSVSSALDLSSTGNWITLRSKDMGMIDRVAFVGGANTLEWPVVSGKHSIVLDSLSYSSGANNYGRNWRVAGDLIPGSSSQYGSPHAK
jgi:hypothetical protein